MFGELFCISLIGICLGFKRCVNKLACFFCCFSVWFGFARSKFQFYLTHTHKYTHFLSLLLYTYLHHTQFVVRILFMVPIFAIQSWFSLFFRSASPYLTAVRDLYEAFVLASFVYYIIELCGGEDQLVDKLRMKDPSYGEHRIFSCQKQQQRRHWQMGRPFLLNCKYGVLQFVFFKIITTIIVIVLHNLDDFHKGSKRWNSSFIALAVIMNLSITYALYCLVKLYFATKDFLKEWNPVWKFLW